MKLWITAALNPYPHSVRVYREHPGQYENGEHVSREYTLAFRQLFEWLLADNGVVLPRSGTSDIVEVDVRVSLLATIHEDKKQ